MHMVTVLCDFYVLPFFGGHSLQWCDHNKHGRVPVWHVWHKNVPNLVASPQLDMASCATPVLYPASLVLVFPSSGIGPQSATGTRYRVNFCASPCDTNSDTTVHCFSLSPATTSERNKL